MRTWYMPCSEPLLPAMLSMSMPMVMRDGKACGLMITSGLMPDSLKGMSSCTSPTTGSWLVSE